MCVCRRSYLRNYTSFWACYLWPFRLGPPLAAYSDVLRISGFMDDVIFAHKLRLLDIATRLRQAAARLTKSLGLGSQEYPLQTADARDYLQPGPTRLQVTRQVPPQGRSRRSMTASFTDV